MSNAIVLDDLKKRFGDKVLLTPSDIAPLIAMSENAQASLRCRGRFPIPVKKIGKRIGVTIYALAEYLATGDFQDSDETVEEIKEVISPPPKLKPRRSNKKPQAIDYSWLLGYKQQLDFEIELYRVLEHQVLNSNIPEAKKSISKRTKV